jgi:hypothetical protein
MSDDPTLAGLAKAHLENLQRLVSAGISDFRGGALNENP